MALALDIRDRDLAVEVMEKFLDDLMATWPARRNDYQIDGWSGACLSNVRVMPDLAPCYVATDDTLVIGWNAGSIRHALAGEAGGAEPGGPESPSATGKLRQALVRRGERSPRLSLAVPPGRRPPGAGRARPPPEVVLSLDATRPERPPRRRQLSLPRGAGGAVKLSRPLLVRLAILVVLVAVAVALVVRTVPRMKRYRAVEAACSAVEDGDWSSALARSAGLTGPDPEGLRAAQCRCLALLQTGGQEACADLLDGLIDDPGTGDWLPSPELTSLVVERRASRGELGEAAGLAHRGATTYPDDPLLWIQS